MNCAIPDTGSNSIWTLVVAALVLAVGAAALIITRRTSHAMALMGLAIVVVGVGVGGKASAVSAPDCTGLPVCFDVPGEAPDLKVETTDGIHLTATSYASLDGTCTGASGGVGTGAIAGTEDEAIAICQGPVTNLQASAPIGVSPTPQANWWGCYGDPG